MKPILIHETNRNKIENYLSEVNGRSKTRVIRTIYVVVSVIGYLEKYLKNTTKKNWNGLRFIYRIGAGKFLKAYKYPANGTAIEFEYKNNKWYILRVWRADVRNEKTYTVYYPELLKKEMISKLEHLELFELY